MAPFRMIGQPKPISCMDKICPVGCGLHGKCIDGKCVCQQGWQGPNCKDPQCPNDCAGHGQCVFQSVHSPGQCICNFGWGGAGCQRVAVYAQLRTCPNDCAGNGLCMDGMCACWGFYAGYDCKMPVACQETCLETCQEGAREEACSSCIGLCESSAPRSNSV